MGGQLVMVLPSIHLKQHPEDGRSLETVRRVSLVYIIVTTVPVYGIDL